MIAPLIIAFTLIILVFLSQEADLYITRKDKFYIRLNLTVFSYPVNLPKGKENKNRKKKKRYIRADLKGFKYLLAHSEVTLSEFDPRPPSNTPLGVLALAPVYALCFSAASYLRGNARLFKVEKLDDNAKSNLEVKISFILFHLIISLLISLYFSLKFKLKKRKKNV